MRDDSLVEVARSQSLKVCSLAKTPLTDQGLEYFRDHPNLEKLSVDHTSITDESIAIFESLPSLKELKIKGTRISKQAIDEFQKRHPDVTILD